MSFEEFYQKTELLAPLLNRDEYDITSLPTTDYNCIAWAAEEDEAWWEPDEKLQRYWPNDVDRSYTIEAWVSAFETLNYKVCDDGELESGFQKVAIYVSGADNPRHMARQLPNGNWTSKLGNFVDLSHKLNGLNGARYGYARVFMKRRTK